MGSTVQSLRAAAASAVLDCGPALSLFSRTPETSNSGPGLVPPPSGPKMHERSSQGGTDQGKGKGGQSCPPHGGKSICGRRPRMEDAYTAYPFLVKVPVPPEDCPVTERLPPRIATQHKEADVTPPGSESGASDADEATLRARRASSSAATTTAGVSSSSVEPRVEALHFFGVFDGHGGAEAAAHCAQTLHQRIAEALSAVTSPSGRSGESAALAGSPLGDSQHRDEPRPPSRFNPQLPATDEAAAEGTGPSDSSVGQLGDAIIEETLLKSEQGAASPPTVGQSCAERFEAALTTAFSQTDEEFGKGDKSALVGTTAVVALIGQRQMYVANCGMPSLCDSCLSLVGSFVPCCTHHRWGLTAMLRSSSSPWRLPAIARSVTSISSPQMPCKCHSHQCMCLQGTREQSCAEAT